MENITVCGVDIEIPNGPVGISVSGGADSVALLYILLNYFPDKEFHVYTAIENLEDFRVAAGPCVSTIIARIQQQIGYRNVQHHITQYNNVSAEFNPSTIYEKAIKDIDRGIIRSVFSGLTASPPLHIAKDWTSDPVMFNEMTSRLPGRNLPTKKRNRYVPLRNHDKLKIAEIYETYELLDWLFPLTFSCEDTDNQLHNLKHCGECWWCKEREWAFGRLV